MPTQIQLRRGTAAQWTSANPTLAQGEVGVETDTNKFKVGTGSTAWNSLAYAGVTGAASSTDGALVAFDGTSGKAIKANGTVTAAQGGTGQTSFTNGQLLIGNASGGLSKATLTAGTNVTITNGDGAITIAASGGGGGTPGGSDTQVQFNDAGSFGGDAGLTYNKTTDVLTATGGFSGPHNGTVGATTPSTGAFTTLSATGVATLSAGTVSAPALTTSGDTNTGMYFSAADEISFATGGSQRVKIGTADLTISNGNLVIGTSGKGIDFSATSGTGTSELLSDYEEGTWTPAITFGGGSTGITYNYRPGTYRKVGNIVTVAGGFQLSSKGSSTGALSITGLPFTALNYGPFGGFAVSFASYATTNLGSSVPYGNLQTGTTNATVFKNNGSGGTTDVTNSDLTDSSFFIFSMTYYQA